MSDKSSTKRFPEIRFTNTQTGEKERFEPSVPGKVSFYSCGPTVYNFIHIGNLRAALVADLIFRYLKHVGYDVTYVRNYTDVDDKIIAQAVKEGISSEAVAKKYIEEVERDYAISGMLEPTHKTTVTTHIQEIIAMIERIIANGKGYVVGGEVFFSIDSFPDYGKLSRRNLEDLEAGARVEVRDAKRNPLDFSLWKPAKPGEPFWESPWGRGRPGWHIECSAMATKWLGAQIDIHHGGPDLVFPHHENEIAQSEGASGKPPYVRYWLHHAFLTMSKEKMSKSLGNVLNARDLLSRFSGEIVRYLLLSVHYRASMDFSDESVESALVSLHRIYEAKAKALEIKKGPGKATADLRAESVWGSFLAECEKMRDEIREALANDLNTPLALGALFKLIREFNRVSSEPLALATPSAILGATELVRVIEEEIGPVIGIGLLLPQKAFDDISRAKEVRMAAEGRQRMSESEILDAIQRRADARKAKDFAQADAIRKELLVRGVAIKDGPSGTTWEYA